MKRILLISIFLFTLSSLFARDPKKLIVQVHYTSAEDTSFLNKIRLSPEACCRFEIVTVKSSENKILVCSEDKTIGTIYGYPTEKFLLDIYMRYISDNE